MSNKRIIASLLIALIVLATAACQSNGDVNPGGSKETNPAGPVKVQAADLLENFKAQIVPEKEADQAFIKASFKLAASLLNQVYAGEKEQKKTLLLSPLSVATALAMTANGAGGETLKQMENLLGSGISLGDYNAYLHTYLNRLSKAKGAEFSFANSIWFRDQADFVVEEAFLQQNVNYYDASIRKAAFDLETVRDINQWVALKTHNMIPSLLDSLDDLDRMILINALVFEAKWEDPFEEGYKHKADFTNLAGKQQEVDYMNCTLYQYLEDESCTGFMKLYEGGEYGFVALLPKNEKNFEGFVTGLSGTQLEQLMGNIQECMTHISMPAFSYDYDASLVDVLRALGMTEAFVSNQADFSGISKSIPLYISDVIHKTHIDVDSEGTKAAAVTAIEMKAGSAMPVQEPKVVTLDRPFVYMIVDVNTGLPVFIGTVTDLGN